MKNNLKLVWLLASILLISFSSACSNNNYHNDDSHNYHSYRGSLDSEDGVIFVVYDSRLHEDSIYSKENEDRQEVYQYKYGYSYRSEERYYEEKETRIHNNQEDKISWFFNGKKERVVYQDEPYYYYTYVDYLDTYQKHQCYKNPARDKLIYTKCP